MPAVKVHTDELAGALVDAAARILAEEGPAALTLRRLARETATSTMAVYTLFGDKQGLLAAMHRAGFERLAAALAEARRSSPDPLESLAQQGRAYRATALANRHLYGLMFGAAAPDFTPPDDGRTVADAAYGVLVDGVRDCLDAGALRGADAEAIAEHFWTVSHGFVSLEIAGHLPGDPATHAARYEEALIYSSAAFLAG